MSSVFYLRLSLFVLFFDFQIFWQQILTKNVKNPVPKGTGSKKFFFFQPPSPHVPQETHAEHDFSDSVEFCKILNGSDHLAGVGVLVVIP